MDTAMTRITATNTVTMTTMPVAMVTLMTITN
jgi:hypothetical protein